VAVLGAVLGLMWDQARFGPDVAKAVLGLGSGLILGGALKYLLDRYQEDQKKREVEHELREQKREEDHEVRERLLGDLRDVYDRTERARLMINAHRSAQAYDAQMRELIGCQAALLKVKRTLDLRPDLRNVVKNAECLQEVIGYLRALQSEFTRNYKSVAECQQYDGEVTHLRLSELAASGAPFDVDAVSQHVWDLMREKKKFPVLYDLTTCGRGFNNSFVRPLNRIAAHLLGTKAPEPDSKFDDRVDTTARAIRSELLGEKRSTRRAPDETAAANNP
jgi:hypothetical protein